MHLSRRQVLAHRRRNALHTGLLLGAMALWTGLLGWVLAGPLGALAGLGTGVFAMVAAGQVSPWVVLRMYGARPLHLREAPDLHRLVRALAKRARLEAVPAVHYIPSAVPNALSVGSRATPAIAVTDGLLRRLSPREVTGVLAHEISHITNGDLRVMAIADSFARFTGVLGQVGFALLLLGMCLVQPALVWAALVLVSGPTLTTLLMLGLSRQREHAADLEAVTLTGDPRGLASALQRIEQPTRFWEHLVGLPGRDLQPSLLRTHPATEDRIRRLLQLEAQPEPLPEPRWAEVPTVTRPPGRQWWGPWL